MPRTCSICKHPQTAKINKAICNSVSYRDIGKTFGMNRMSVMRHTHQCLNLQSEQVTNGHKEKQVIDVYKEFAEQLAFAKELRESARKVLVIADTGELSLDDRATRKFALDAINTTDTCIDKFAKLGGLYTKERENPETLGNVAATLLRLADMCRIEYAERDVFFDGVASCFVAATGLAADVIATEAKQLQAASVDIEAEIVENDD